MGIFSILIEAITANACLCICTPAIQAGMQTDHGLNVKLLSYSELIIIWPS